MNRKRLWLASVFTVLVLAGCGAGQQGTDADTKPAAETPTVTGTGQTAAEKQKDAQLPETQKKVEERGADELAAENGGGQPQVEETLLGEVSCRLPKGFVQYENNPGIFVCGDYPKDIACISYIIADYDGQEIGAEETDFLERLQEDFKDGYGEDVEVEATGYETFQVGGCSAVKVELSYRLLGTPYEMTQLIIFDAPNGQEHIFNFIQEKGGKWAEGFQECISSITLR